MRQRIDLNIGRDLSSHALRIDLRRQRRGLFGVWVEQEKYWDPRRRDFVGYDLYPEQKTIAEKVLARAVDLAQNGTQAGASGSLGTHWTCNLSAAPSRSLT